MLPLLGQLRPDREDLVVDAGVKCRAGDPGFSLAGTKNTYLEYVRAEDFYDSAILTICNISNFVKKYL